MKQIDQYIASNKEIKKNYIEQFEKTSPEEKEELKRLLKLIDRIDYYIKGLEDAKKYIKEEIKEW